MRLSRIQINNFRNFKNLNIQLGDHVVILGENKVGKTNFLFALRLILDPQLPDSARRLRLEDFWDGLPRPLTLDDVIEISLEFMEFEDSENLLAVLADHLVQTEPMVARITYRFQPIAGLTSAPKSEAGYEFVIFGGGRFTNIVGYDLRRWMPMDLFPALRDAEADLARWTRSPLRPLLDRAAQTINAEELKGIANDVYQATSAIAELSELAQVVADVNTQLNTMVGKQHAVETALGFAPTEPDRLLRALQLMIDGGVRGVAEASLGSANVLYLALKHLEHQYLVDEGIRQHTFLAIEEPEAHLHPHLQRLIYRNYLRTKDDQTEKTEPRSIVLTTHSPNVASVARLSNIAVLRHNTKKHHTTGHSLHNVGRALKDQEREDIERYIDVTRGEIFFSKGVILVEGDAEKFMLPTLAKLYDPSFDFDALGITVCSISGTNFGPYVQLLGPKGLGIPFVVLTDFDPKSEEISQEDADPDDAGVEDCYGKNRVVNQIMKSLMDEEHWNTTNFEDIIQLAPTHGVFLNTFTFEIDLFKAGAHTSYYHAVCELTTNKKMHARFLELSNDSNSLVPKQFLKDIDSIGKGRMAQRLAAIMTKKNDKACPKYIQDALKHLREQLS